MAIMRFRIWRRTGPTLPFHSPLGDAVRGGVSLIGRIPAAAQQVVQHRNCTCKGQWYTYSCGVALLAHQRHRMSSPRMVTLYVL